MNRVKQAVEKFSNAFSVPTRARQEIWLASYLTTERFESFKNALKSFNNQTTLAPVILSVCGPEAWRATGWARNILTKATYELRLYEERLSQFDQLYRIVQSREPCSDRVYISVCDDDDWFEPNRIEIQQSFIDKKLWPTNTAFRCKVIGEFVNRDFGCFCFNLEHLKWFFSDKAREMRKNHDIPPDVLFMASVSWYDIDEAIHNRINSMWTRRYNELRDDGTKWFTLTALNDTYQE